MIKAGRYHLVALSRAEDTKGLATAFKPAVDDLAAAHAARERAEEALLEPRVTARFAESALEAVLREVASAAHSNDRKTGGGLVFKAIFPNGLDAEVRPRGSGQLTASTGLRERLNSQPAAAAVKAQWLRELDTAVATLGTALEARRMAEQALGIARAVEDGARETFVSSYDSNAGAIRQRFPRNRERQDLYFDRVRTSQASSNDEPNEPDPAPPLPAPQTT
jgi:hypothetical protein